jgi:hypothetical protein
MNIKKQRSQCTIDNNNDEHDTKLEPIDRRQKLIAFKNYSYTHWLTFCFNLIMICYVTVQISRYQSILQSHNRIDSNECIFIDYG